MLAKPDFPDAFNDDHVVTNCSLTFGFEHRQEFVGLHARTFSHFQQRFGCAERSSKQEAREAMTRGTQSGRIGDNTAV